MGIKLVVLVTVSRVLSGGGMLWGLFQPHKFFQKFLTPKWNKGVEVAFA